MKMLMDKQRKGLRKGLWQRGNKLAADVMSYFLNYFLLLQVSLRKESAEEKVDGMILQVGDYKITSNFGLISA